MKKTIFTLISFLALTSSSQATNRKECSNFDSTVKLTIEGYPGGPAPSPGTEWIKTQLFQNGQLLREAIYYFGVPNPQIQGNCEFQAVQEETIAETRTPAGSIRDSWMKIQFCLNDVTIPVREIVLVCRRIFEPRP